MNARNVVLTGLPRGGTTLSCYLVGKVRNTVALNEPIRRDKFVHLLPDREAVADGVERYFRRARRKIESKGVAYSKHLSGELSDATFGKPNTEGVRKPVLQKGEIAVEKELESNFFLVIKHPALFTALLPSLVARFPCYAVVRNPLAVLASRSSLGRDGGPTGKLPKVLRIYDEELRHEIDSMDGDIIDARLRTLSWACERYDQYLPEENVVRYEDIVASEGKALSTVVPAAKELDEPLEGRNLNVLVRSRRDAARRREAASERRRLLVLLHQRERRGATGPDPLDAPKRREGTALQADSISPFPLLPVLRLV